MSKSKQLIVFLFSIPTIIFANEPALTTSEIRSFPLEKYDLGIRFNYNRINDSIDIFDIKQKELGTTKNYGSIGDSSGIDLSLAYGVNEYLSLFYNYNYLGMHYIDEKLKNHKNELYLKLNIYRNPMSFFETLSTDIGFIRNSADDLSITSSNTLNSFIKKIKPNTNLSIDGTNIYYNGATKAIINILDENNEPISPYIKIGDMSDNSFYVRFLTGFAYETNIVDLYAGLKYTKINSQISLEPRNNSTLNNFLKGFDQVVDLERNEKTFFLGFNYTVEFGNFLIDANYEYLTIWGRDADTKETEDNHIINGALSYIINNNLLVFIGGKLMLHQFNGVIPYLYNKYTKNKYDKKYGYAKVGFVYNFDTSALMNISASTEYRSY
jgi:hypothetical protein